MSAKPGILTAFPSTAFPYRRVSPRKIFTVFCPLLRRLAPFAKGKRRTAYRILAAPPAAGKSTLAAYLSSLVQELPDCLPMQALGLDGFHFHQDYILTHNVRQKDGHILPMRQVKAARKPTILVHFAEKLAALGRGRTPCGPSTTAASTTWWKNSCPSRTLLC